MKRCVLLLTGWLSLLLTHGWASADNAAATTACPVVTEANIDAAIQHELAERYMTERCYKQDAEPLTDGIVGDVTKRWIYKTLTQDSRANLEPKAATDGIRPIMLLEQDLIELTLNNEVLELLTALTQDASKNRFVTVTEAQGAISNELSSLMADNTALLASYVTFFSTMIAPYTEQLVTQATLDALVAEGHMAAADGVKSLLDIPQETHNFTAVVENTLATALLAEASASSDAKPESTLVKLEKKTDAEFKSKVAEIAAIGEDSESLIKKLISFGKKLNPIGKDFKALKQDKAKRHTEAEAALAKLQAEGEDTTAAVDDDESYRVAMSILLSEIKKHEKSAIALNKKGKDDEADKASFIANELKGIYFDELARIQENIKIDKKNKENAAAQKQAEADAKAQAREEAVIAAAKAELAASEAMAIIKNKSTVQTRYRVILADNLATALPSLHPEVAACARHLVGVSYISEYSLRRALENMLTSLDNVATPATDNHFSCTVDTPLTKGTFAQSDAVEIILSKAIKPYLNSGLQPINLQPLPGCTRCAEPMQGLSYGFYPYWQASSEYQEIKIPTKNPAFIDFSAFTNIAYFALAINEQGQLNDQLHMGNTRYAKTFFASLARYNVKRDIVIYSSDWQHWGANSESTIGKESLIKKYAEDHYKALVNMHREFIEYGGISGVTFYFDHYDAAAKADNILTYINQFYTKMTLMLASSTDFDLKLMLGIEGLEAENPKIAQRITASDDNYFLKLSALFIANHDASGSLLNRDGLQKLVNNELDGLFSITAQAEPIISHILVAMNENSSSYKKFLRAQIENEFRGDNRVKALSAVVPIIGRIALTERDKEELNQFQEDLAYLKDNFGGMGLWNIPYTGVDEKDNVQAPNLLMQAYASLLKNSYANGNQSYLDREKIGVVGQLLLSQKTLAYLDVCGLVCPKRQLFVQLLILSLAINMVMSVYWRINCQARVLIKKTWPLRELLLFGSLLLFLALLGCHPIWQAYSQTILGVFVAAVLLKMIYRIVSGSYEASDEVH